MRAAIIIAAVASVASASAIPALDEASSAHTFDKREDLTASTLGGKILSADLYAGVAGLNQQIYQATQKGDQWKKCNPLNIIVRREWYASTSASKTNKLTGSGLPSLPQRSATTFLQYNAWPNFHQRLPSLNVRDARIVTMTLWQPTLSRPFLYVSCST
jgi:hypothetical protein